MTAPTPAPPIPASAGGIQVTDLFKTSYKNFQLYPSNLVYKSTYPAALNAYSARLDRRAPRLFHHGQSSVWFFDFTGVGTNGGLQTKEVIDEASLEACLGNQSGLSPAGGLVTKKDPKCRLIFITADSSRKPLRITRKILEKVSSYHQVMASYVNFLLVFGSQHEARDLRYSGFREQVVLKKPVTGLVIPSLGRSGKQYQLSYNLKAVACKSRPDTPLSDQQWSIRQAAIHHQFDVKVGTTLWIATQGHLSLKERIQDMTSSAGRPEDRDFTSPEQCFRTSLNTHLLFCHWSIEEWRWYIQWLEEVIEQETETALFGSRGTQQEHYFVPNDLQKVQFREDRTNEAIMVLEANRAIISSLRDFYRRLLENKDFDLKPRVEQDIITFATQLDDMVYDSNLQISRAEVLVKIASDRKNMILQHLQGQATGKMEVLTQLTIKVATMAQREAIAMRIITVVTLVYLPATFVSTFFSTDIIKYQNPNAGSGTDSTSTGPYMGSFSKIALIRWLQLTIPLTAMTLVVGYFAYRLFGKKANKELADAQILASSYSDSEVSSQASQMGVWTSFWEKMRDHRPWP